MSTSMLCLASLLANILLSSRIFELIFEELETIVEAYLYEGYSMPFNKI